MRDLIVRLSTFLLACFVMAPTEASGADLVRSFNLAANVGNLKAIRKPDLDGFKGSFRYTGVPDAFANNSVSVQQLYDVLGEIVDAQEQKVIEALRDVDQKVAKRLEKYQGFDNEDREDAMKPILAELSNVLNNSGKGIVEITINDMEAAVKAKLKELEEEETDYKWSETKFVVDMVWQSIKLTLAVVRLAGTSGADVTAWVSGVNAVKNIATELYKRSESAEATGNDVTITYKRLQTEAKKAYDQKKFEKTVLEIGAVKTAKGTLEKRLKEFKNKITALDAKSKTLSAKVQDLLAADPSEAKRADVEKDIDKLLKEIVTLQTAVKDLTEKHADIKTGMVHLTKDYNKFVKTAGVAANELPGILILLISNRDKIRQIAELF